MHDAQGPLESLPLPGLPVNPVPVVQNPLAAIDYQVTQLHDGRHVLGGRPGRFQETAAERKKRRLKRKKKWRGGKWPKWARSPLAVAVVAEGALQQAVERHQGDVVERLDVRLALCRQVAPLVLEDGSHARR